MAASRFLGFSKLTELPILTTVRCYSVNVANAKSGIDGFQNDFETCHLETSSIQKVLLGFGSAVVSLADPRRGDMIAAMGETTGTKSLQFIRNKMSNSEEGKSILADKPRITSSTIDLDKLRNLKEDSVGKAYANFLDRYGYSPDARLAVRFVDDIELAYVIQRYREVHDLFHTILNMPTNMLGEVTVKWVEGVQTRLPMCVGGALFGAARLAPKYARSFSTQHVQLDESVRSQLETDQMRPKKHPGIMRLPCIYIPEPLRKTIKAVIEDRQLTDIERGGKDLANYLFSRKLPPELHDLKQCRKELYEAVLSSLPSGDVTPKNQEEQEYFDKIASEKVSRLMWKRVYNWKPLNMDNVMSYCYLVQRTSAEYAVLMRIMNEISIRDPSFAPRNLFDFGSGVGTVSWVAHELWGGSIREYYTVDSSPDANNLALLILQNNQPTSEPFLKTLYQRQFLPATARPYDLVVSAFSLFELESAKSRLNVISNLWQKTQRYLIIAEQGTNAGFEVVSEARDFVLHMAQRSGQECHVFAPCPHEAPCPRLAFPESPCNFLVKYSPFPDFRRESTSKQERFSFVVIKKGPRSQTDPQWPRVVREVLSRHNHTICRLCSKNGSLEEIIVTSKKHGKSAYKCSRYTSWGDLLPIASRDDTS